MPDKTTTLLLAVLTILLWGLWGFFGKLALNRGMSPILILIFEVAASFALVLPIAVFYARSPSPNLAWNRYGILSGLGLVLGLLTYYLALSRGKAALIIPLTATYPLIAAALSFLLLKERLSPTQWIGVAALTVGTLLVVSGEFK